jgi:Tfp pilus assembly protein PilZ
MYILPCLGHELANHSQKNQSTATIVWARTVRTVQRSEGLGFRAKGPTEKSRT